MATMILTCFLSGICFGILIAGMLLQKRRNWEFLAFARGYNAGYEDCGKGKDLDLFRAVEEYGLHDNK